MPCQRLSLDVESRGTSLALAPPTRVCVCVWRSISYLTLPYPTQALQQRLAVFARGEGEAAPPRRRKAKINNPLSLTSDWLSGGAGAAAEGGGAWGEADAVLRHLQGHPSSEQQLPMIK